MLHAVFHGALVGPHLVVTAQAQRAASGVHALADLIVLQTSLHVGGLLGFNKLTLKRCNFFRVVELHHVHGLVDTHGVQRGHGQYVRIPLHHDVRKVSEPDRALFGCHALAVVAQGVLPALVNRAARRAGLWRCADSLHRVMLCKFPAQVVAGDKATQTGVKGANMVVLQIHLNEGLPVVVALMHFDFVQNKAGEVQIGLRAHARQFGLNVTSVVLKQQAVPLP